MIIGGRSGGTCQPVLCLQDEQRSVSFVRAERYVADLLASEVTLNGEYLQVFPLALPSTRVTISGVPSFIPDKVLKQELCRFGKMASGFGMVELGCKNDKLMHFLSFRRQVFMFLNCPSQTLDVSFRVRHGQGQYMAYARKGSMRCFECADGTEAPRTSEDH